MLFSHELVWTQGIMIEMRFMFKTLMRLYCANQSAIYIAPTSVFHEKTKHIEVDCHLV